VSNKESVMNAIVRNGAAALCAVVALSLSACASSVPRADRLAMYQANAGAPVKQIRYFSPQGWEEVDDHHIILTMRPTEVYLVRLSGPCLDYDNGAAGMLISNTGGWVQQKFDRVSFGSPISCRIEEIRPVDVAGYRAARDAYQGSL
jgi:hypothetical protein